MAHVPTSKVNNPKNDLDSNPISILCGLPKLTALTFADQLKNI